MRTKIYNLGDHVTYKDKYWGKMQGTIIGVGHQGTKCVFGVKLDSGGMTTATYAELSNN